MVHVVSRVSVMAVSIVFSFIIVVSSARSASVAFYFNVLLGLNVYGTQNFIYPVPFKMVPSQGSDLFAAIVHERVDEVCVKVRQSSDFKEFEMGITAVVCVGKRCPYGHYAWVLHGVSLA
jgi:hypothetical protein